MPGPAELFARLPGTRRSSGCTAGIRRPDSVRPGTRRKVSSSCPGIDEILVEPGPGRAFGPEPPVQQLQFFSKRRYPLQVRFCERRKIEPDEIVGIGIRRVFHRKIIGGRRHNDNDDDNRESRKRAGAMPRPSKSGSAVFVTCRRWPCAPWQRPWATCSGPYRRSSECLRPSSVNSPAWSALPRRGIRATEPSSRRLRATVRSALSARRAAERDRVRTGTTWRSGRLQILRPGR